MDEQFLAAMAVQPSLMTTSAAGPMPGASASTGDAVSPAANRIFYTPFVVRYPIRAIRIGWINGVVSGNVLAGIYSRTGNQLYASASTAQSGANAFQTVTLDVWLGRGRYYYALSIDNTTGRFQRASPTVSGARLSGMRYEDPGSFTLPATATFAAAIDSYIPVMGISEWALS